MSSKKSKTVLALTFCTAAVMFSPVAFDWPQSETKADSFRSYFAQLRGSRIEASIIFNDSSTDVKCAEDGTVAAVIAEHGNDFGWFESPLGTAVVIAHEDNLSTVYANLDGDSVPQNFCGGVPAGKKIGESGNSGWQQDGSGLEFQVLDTENKACVNPRILMPRIGEELDLVIGDLTLDDRSGVTHHLLNERKLPAGSYKLYHARQEVAVPYTTQVAVNGVTVETMKYDRLLENNGELCVLGNDKYPVKDVYPDEKRQLLSVLHLAKGHCTLSVFVIDILGKAHQIKYSLEIE